MRISVSHRGKHSVHRLGVALVSLDLWSRHLTLGRVDACINFLSLNRYLLTIAICLVPFLGHMILRLINWNLLKCIASGLKQSDSAFKVF